MYKKPPQTFGYCEYSETIRAFPANFLIAYKKGNAWVVDPDGACPKWMKNLTFKVVTSSWHARSNTTGKELLELINKEKNKIPSIINKIING